MNRRLNRAVGALLPALVLALPAAAAFAASPTPPGASPFPTGTYALATAARIVAAPAPPTGYTAAPTPSALDAPLPLDANSKSPEFSPGMFRQRKAFNGEGYIQGSTVQDQQQRKSGPSAGIALKVPLN